MSFVEGRSALLPDSRLDCPIAVCHGETLGAERFLGEAVALAERLPTRPWVINLCANRYHFLLMFVAALLRGQVSLLPHNRTAAAVRALVDEYPDAYVACDEAPPDAGAVTFFVGRPVRCPREAPNPMLDGSRPVALVFTSGSTGRPEPHEKTWDIFRRSVDLIAEHLGVASSQGHVTVATVPAQHMYGLETTILLPLRSRCVLTDRPAFYPADVQSALAALPAPRMLVTTPIHLRACLASGIALPRVDLIVSATAPLPVELARTAEERFGGVLREIYGFTEAGSVATRRTSSDDRWTLFRGLELDGVDGGLRLLAPYLKGPVPLQDRLESTGGNRFRWLGRLSDHINVAGKRASLTALNATLQALPGVEDGAFFVPSSAGDEAASTARLIAFAVAPRRTRSELMAELRQHLDPAFLPRPLFLVEGLPRQENGKLSREALEALAESCRRRR